MPLRPELKASDSGPGYALLTISGWSRSADSIELAVQNNQGGHYLDANGNWTTDTVWHDVSVLDENNGVLNGEMGPWLVDPLLRNPQWVYMFELRSPDHKDKGVLRIAGTILSSLAAGSSTHREVRTSHPQTARLTPQEVPAPPPQPEPVKMPEPAASVAQSVEIQKEPVQAAQPPAPPFVPDIESEPGPVSPVGKPPGSKLPLVLGLLAVLLLAGGGAAWYFGLLPFGKQASATGGDSEAAAGPCGEQAMAGADLAFIQGCLKSSPSSEQVLKVIATAKQAKRCEIARRLYAYKAQGGDTRIALAYAREYDPDSFEAGGCIENADKETATYWYEIVVSKEPDNGEAKRRLEELGK